MGNGIDVGYEHRSLIAVERRTRRDGVKVVLVAILLLYPALASAKPDIVGISIGTSLADTEQRLRAHNPDLQVQRKLLKPTTTKIAPFVAELMATAGNNFDGELLFIHFSGPPVAEEVTALARLQGFPKNEATPSVAATRTALIEKYGTPVIDKDDLLIWSDSAAVKQAAAPGAKSELETSVCTRVEEPRLSLGAYPFPSDRNEVKTGKSSLAKCGLLVGARLKPRRDNPALLDGLTVMLIDYANLEERRAKTEKYLQAALQEQEREEAQKAANQAPKL